MANGRPGDHPYTGIVLHGREAISPEVTRLVREIEAHQDPRLRRVVQDLLWHMDPATMTDADESWMKHSIESLENDLQGLLEIANELKSQ